MFRIGYSRSDEGAFEVKPIIVLFGRLALKYYFAETGLALTFYRRYGWHIGVTLTVYKFSLLLRTENVG